MTESKICINCKEKFERRFQTDYSWNLKRFCGVICNQEWNRQKYKNLKNGTGNTEENTGK